MEWKPWYATEQERLVEGRDMAMTLFFRSHVDQSVARSSPSFVCLFLSWPAPLQHRISHTLRTMRVRSRGCGEATAHDASSTSIWSQHHATSIVFMSGGSPGEVSIIMPDIGERERPE